MARRAKIVCTLGPASAAPGVLGQLVSAGLDVARLNLSHGTHDDHRGYYYYYAVRAAATAAGRGVGVLADLQGPKIRLGRFASGPVRLVAGDLFSTTTLDVPGGQPEVSTTYQGLPQDVRRGVTHPHPIL